MIQIWFAEIHHVDAEMPDINRYEYVSVRRWISGTGAISRLKGSSRVPGLRLPAYDESLYLKSTRGRLSEIRRKSF